jgi:hypothetical protein
LNQQLPLDAAFVDESGKPVKLGDYFGKHPALYVPDALFGGAGRYHQLAGDGEADAG